MLSSACVLLMPDVLADVIVGAVADVDVLVAAVALAACSARAVADVAAKS